MNAKTLSPLAPCTRQPTLPKASPLPSHTNFSANDARFAEASARTAVFSCRKWQCCGGRAPCVDRLHPGAIDARRRRFSLCACFPRPGVRFSTASVARNRADRQPVASPTGGRPTTLAVVSPSLSRMRCCWAQQRATVLPRGGAELGRPLRAGDPEDGAPGHTVPDVAAAAGRRPACRAGAEVRRPPREAAAGAGNQPRPERGGQRRRPPSPASLSRYRETQARARMSVSLCVYRRAPLWHGSQRGARARGAAARAGPRLEP